MKLNPRGVFTALVLALALPMAAFAQQPPVSIIGLLELSGTGATPGTNFDNGVKLAIKEINASGGILGRQIDYATWDTQTNPGVAKALEKKRPATRAPTWCWGRCSRVRSWSA
jgi:branched-chain amino acid transport system substrate-binding protein